MAARFAMIAITTSSSIRVKPARRSRRLITDPPFGRIGRRRQRWRRRIEKRDAEGNPLLFRREMAAPPAAREETDLLPELYRADLSAGIAAAYRRANGFLSSTRAPAYGRPAGIGATVPAPAPGWGRPRGSSALPPLRRRGGGACWGTVCRRGGAIRRAGPRGEHGERESARIRRGHGRAVRRAARAGGGAGGGALPDVEDGVAA